MVGMDRMRRRRTFTILPVLTALAVCAFPLAASAETIALAAEMTGATQVPPNPSKGKGALTAAYDTETKTLTWSGTYAGLTGQPVAAHFHGPADTKMNAPVAVNLDKHASPFQGTATLTDAQAADLLAGRWYVNFHTPSYPGGELRGQVTRAK
jgi:CHRD domain